jgi:hypothetical protein
VEILADARAVLQQGVHPLFHGRQGFNEILLSWLREVYV